MMDHQGERGRTARGPVEPAIRLNQNIRLAA
jgi:hypothetical protein